MGTPAELDHNGAKIAYPGYLMRTAPQPYYTISAKELQAFLNDSPPAADKRPALNILLDMEVQQLPELLMVLNSARQNFLFSLPGNLAKDTTALKALLPACYLLVSLDLYEAADMPFIPVLCEEGEIEFPINLLHDYFQEQGIQELRTPRFYI